LALHGESRQRGKGRPDKDFAPVANNGVRVAKIVDDKRKNKVSPLEEVLGALVGAVGREKGDADKLLLKAVRTTQRELFGQSR
jgi:hypothetical protein